MSSQINQCSILADQGEFRTFFQPEEVLDQIQKKSIDLDCIKDKDVVIVLGSTGSGKSTTLNFLMGKKMILKTFSCTNYLQGYDGLIDGGDYEEIGTEENEDEFEIGFKKQSQTLHLKVKQLSNSDLFICDTTGFNDNRGFDVELSNQICLSIFIKQCRSICPILIINYNDMQATKGQLFKELLVSFSKFIETESMKQVLYFFTHVPIGKKKTHVKTQIVQSYESLKDSMTPQLQTLIFSILDNFNERAFILNPLDDDPQNYIDKIKTQEFINSPDKIFKINLSEDTETKLKIYSEDLFQYVIRCTQKGFLIEKIIDPLNQFLEIKKNLQKNFMEDKFNKSIDYVVKYALQTKNIAFKNLNFSKKLQCQINEEYIIKIKECLEQTKKINLYRNNYFQEYQFSYQNIIDEISFITKDLFEEVKKVFQQYKIESFDLKLLRMSSIKILQLFKLLPNYQRDLQNFQEQINNKLQFQINTNTFLIQLSFLQKDDKKIKYNVEMIAKSFQLYKEIDTQLDRQLMSDKKIELFQTYMQRFKSQLGLQFNSLKIKFIDIQRNLDQNLLPSQIQFKQILTEKDFFDIKVLFELYSQKYLQENIEICQQYVGEMKQIMETLLQGIINYMINNSQKKKYLKEFKDGFDILNYLTQLNQIIKFEINLDYITLIQNIKKKISKIKTQIKYEIKLINSNELFEKGSSQIHTILMKSMKKLKKYSYFLHEVSWIDDKLKAKCVQQTIKSMKKAVNKYFVSCLENCEELNSDQNFERLNSFLKCLYKLGEIKDLINDFDEKFNNCVETISTQIVEYLNQIQFTIQSIVNEKESFPTQNQLREINSYLAYKSKIEKMKNPILSIKKADSLQQQLEMNKSIIYEQDKIQKIEIEIYNDFEEYFKKIFEEFQKFFKEKSADEIKKFMMEENKKRGLAYWKNFSIMLDFCSKECQWIIQIIGSNSFKETMNNAINVFQDLQHFYKETKSDQMRQDSLFLVDIQNQYDLLEKFIDTFSNLESLSFMKLLDIQNPKQIIKESVQKLQKAIKLNQFDEIKAQILQLEKLQDQNSKDQLINCMNLLEEYQQQILTSMRFQVDQKNNNLCVQESLIEKLRYLKQIQNINNKKNSQNLENIFIRYVNQKINQIFDHITNLQFNEIHPSFSLILLFINFLQKDYSDLFSGDFFKQDALGKEQLKQKIQFKIQNLYEFYEKQKLFNLNKKLKQMIALQLDDEDPFIETYKEELLKNFNRLRNYADQELKEIEKDLEKINSKYQTEIASLRLKKLEYFFKKFQKQISFVQNQQKQKEYELYLQQLEKNIEQNISELIRIQNNLSIIYSHDSFQEKESKLQQLKNENASLYKKEIETIEIAVIHSLTYLLNSHSIIEKQIRDQQVKYLRKCLKYKSHFSNETKEELLKIFQELQKSIEQFFNSLETSNQQNKKLFNLFDYCDFVKLLAQSSDSCKNLEEIYQQKVNCIANLLQQIENRQKELIQISDQMKSTEEFQRIYLFTKETEDMINLYFQKKNQILLLDGQKLNLNLQNLEQVEEGILKYFQNVKQEIEINFKQSNFKKLRQNIQILNESQQLNSLLKKKIVLFQEELQSVQLKAQKIVSLVIQDISTQKQNEQTYQFINQLYEFQDELSNFDDLNISAQLESILSHLEVYIENICFSQVYECKIFDRLIIQSKVIQQFPNLQGKIKDIINIQINKSINSTF